MDLIGPEAQLAVAGDRVTWLGVRDQPAHRARDVLPCVLINRAQVFGNIGQALHRAPRLKRV